MTSYPFIRVLFNEPAVYLEISFEITYYKKNHCDAV